MPASTHHVVSEVTDFPSTTEARLVAGGLQYQQVGAMFAVFNPRASGRKITVAHLDVGEVAARTGVLPTTMTMQRLSAVSGGRAIAPTKLDSNATSLPSQVSIVREPSSFTTSGSTLRNMFAAPQLNATRAVPTTMWRRSGMVGQAGVNASGAVFNAADTNVQAQILREGEGLALLTGSLFNGAFPVEVFVHLYAGANYHVVSAVLALSAHPCPLAIFNGSGSGVVLKVVRVELAEVRTDDAIRLISMETISGLAGGFDMTTTPADSANPLNSLVQVRSNTAVFLRGPDAAPFNGGRWPDTQFRTRALPTSGVGPALALLGVQALCGPISRDMFGSKTGQANAFVLREGEGVAVLQRNTASGFGSYIIEAILTDEPGSGTLNLSSAEVY